MHMLGSSLSKTADSIQNADNMPIISAKQKTDEAVKSIAQFQSGAIKPISTGFSWLDGHLLGGFLPSTIMTIGGLSNHGKTYLMQKLEKIRLHFLERNSLLMVRV